MADRDLRTELVDRAAALIAEGGASALGLREVARRAGVSHAAPGHHFGDKTGLLQAVAIDVFRRFADHLERRVEASGAVGRDRIRAAGVAYVEFAVENLELFDFVFRDDQLDRAEPTLAAEATRSFAVLTQAVEGAQVAGFGVGVDAEDLVRLCWATAHGLASISASGEGRERPDLREIDRLMALQLDGLDALGAAVEPFPS